MRLILLIMVLTPTLAVAQVPAIPAMPVVPVTPLVAAAPAKNLYSFFLPTPEQKALCKAHFCSSPAGQLVNNLLKPAGSLTGGLLGPVCPGPLAADPANLAKPADSPQGAAARIKAEEAQAAAKVADLEYLATKNCKRYPEAEAALINGLRAEPNECVASPPRAASPGVAAARSRSSKS